MSVIQGLTKSEVKAKIETGKVNFMPLKTTKTYGEIFQRNIFNFINNILYLICFSLLLLGRIDDAIVTVIIVLINVSLGLIQEVRAKKKLDEITESNRPKVKVLRNGKIYKADPNQIVLGDIISVNPGDQIVVDGKIVEGDKIGFDESSLTGESDVLKKSLGDEVLSGSFCLSGAGLMEVTKVGKDCVMNQITSGVVEQVQVLTPLQKEINTIIRLLVLISIYLQVLIFFSGVFGQNNSLADIVGRAGVIIGIVPNGLFLMVTLAYSLGAIRISNKKILIQELNAVESLSNVTTLCMDKTGTLTSGELEFYEMHTFNLSSDKVNSHLANLVYNQTGKNATTLAICKKFKGETKKILDKVDFSSKHKWSGLIFEKGKTALIIGAPDILSKSLKLDLDQREKISNYNNQGLRTLLLVKSKNPQTEFKLEKEEPILPEDLELIAILALKDKLRPNLKHTLESFQQAGIKFKVISGDNPETVLALVNQLDLGFELKAVSGMQLGKMNQNEFKQAVKNSQIFGRITPIQKGKIVDVLKESGEYVAMVGDGVNDVLSLRKADLSISMESGSQATRGVSDIVLLEDDFNSLPLAFMEGQRIQNGMSGVMSLFLTRVFFTILIIIAVSVIGGFPFSIRQNSFLALFTVGLPAFGLTYWAKPGNKYKRSLLAWIKNFVLPASMVMSIFLLLIYISYLYFGNLIAERTLELDTIFAFILNQRLSSRVQAILTIFTVFSALTLVFFIAPLNDFFKTKIQITDDKKPSYLALILISLVIFILYVGDSAYIFDLRTPDLWETIFLTSFYLIWLFLMKYIFKHEIFNKFLDVNER
jgi:cation-transporting P-type ATPase E